MTAAARRLRPAPVLGCLGALGLLLSGCGQADPEPSIPEMAEPPSRQVPEPSLAVQAQIPVWGHSAACDQPRPGPDEDGLRIPAPAPDEQDVAFFVPAAELTLCQLPGVVSASLAGSFAVVDGARDGDADLGLAFAPEATAEQIEQAWSTGVAEAEAQLAGTGISVGQASLLLDDGSMISGPAAGSGAELPLPGAGVAAPAAQGSGFPQAIGLLAALQDSAPGAQEPASPSSSPSAQQPRGSQESQAPERRWSIRTGQQLEVTTVFAADLSGEKALPLMSRVLRESGDAAPTEDQTARRDAVTIIDGRMRLTVPDAHVAALTPELLTDLHELGQVPDLQATARIEGADGAAPVLRVRSERLPEYSHPEYEEAAAALETSAADAGLRLDHRLDGEPLPLEDEDQAEDGSRDQAQGADGG